MGLKYSWIICNDVVTEEAVRRPSEAEIRHEEGFEVVTRRRRRRATGEDEVVGGGGWTVQKQQKKDVSFGGGGGSAVWGCWRAKAQGGEDQMASSFTVRQQELTWGMGRVSLGARQILCSCFHFGFDKLYLPNWESKTTPCNPGWAKKTAAKLKNNLQGFLLPFRL